MPTKSVMTIGRIASLSGVGIETIRYYEREGFIQQPKRKLGSVRQYPEDTIKRVRFIKRVQELGFTLSEVKDLLSMRAKKGSCASVMKKAERKLEQIETKIHDLQVIQTALIKIKQTCGNQSASAID